MVRGEKRNKSLLGDVSLLYRSLLLLPSPPRALPPLSLSPPFVILGVCLPSSPIESGCTSERTITHVSLGWAVTGCEEGRGRGDVATQEGQTGQLESTQVRTRDADRQGDSGHPPRRRVATMVDLCLTYTRVLYGPVGTAWCRQCDLSC